MKKRFNIIDLIVILFVCAVVIFVAVKFTNSSVLKSSEENTKSVVYTVKISDVANSTSAAVPESGKLYDEDGIEIGDILSKTVKNAEITNTKADGTYVNAVNPGRYDVILEVGANAVIEKEGYFINGKKNIGAGSTLDLKAKNIKFWAQIVEVKEQ